MPCCSTPWTATGPAWPVKKGAASIQWLLAEPVNRPPLGGFKLSLHSTLSSGWGQEGRCRYALIDRKLSLMENKTELGSFLQNENRSVDDHIMFLV